MSIDMGVIRYDVADHKAIVYERKTGRGERQDKFYITDNDKADKFIKSKKNNNYSNQFQSGLSIITSLLVGLLIGTNIKKSNIFAKMAAGGISAVGSLVGLTAIDILLDKWTHKQVMKKAQAIEISQSEVDKILEDEKKKNEV